MVSIIIIIIGGLGGLGFFILQNRRKPKTNLKWTIPGGTGSPRVSSNTKSTKSVANSVAKNDPAKDLKLPAMIFSENTYFNIRWGTIPERLGNPVMLDPSMPRHDSRYMVIETKGKEGEYQAYDPRESAVVSDETPYFAFDTINVYRVVAPVYANQFGLWDKINTILVAILGIGLLLVPLAVLSAK
jgi:hypothetical protein